MIEIVRELPLGFRLFRGNHQPPVDGQPLELCLDEAVAWMFGEEHSAAPACMCRILARYGMRLNDRLDDDERQLLVRLLPALGGTRSTCALEFKRSLVLVDAAIREIVPMVFVAARLTAFADRIRALAPIVDATSARIANMVYSEIRTKIRKTGPYAAYAAAADAAAYADAAADAAYAAADAAADAALSPEERDRIRATARRPIVEASISAFERAIAIVV